MTGRTKVRADVDCWGQHARRHGTARLWWPTGGGGSARLRKGASLLLSMMLVVASLTLAVVSSGVGPAVAAPGTPGTPQPATIVFAEDFENRPAPTPIVKLTAYTGTTGQTYTADPAWLTGCNGWIASGSESTTDPAAVSDCGAQGNWNQAQRMAEGLGMLRGQSGAESVNNYAVSAYTAGNPGAPKVEFATATNIAFATQNRFLTFSVDVAAINCGSFHPLLQFSLVNDAAVATPAGAQIDGCTSTTSVSPPAVGVIGGGAIRVGTYTANGSVLISGSSFGVQMVNNQASGSGNDHAFDNIRVLDVTPQLDKSFSPTVVGVGQSSTLTFTITNTDELGSKNGWSFTDNLPAGLTTVGPAATTCPSGVVTAPVGETSVAVTGNLTVGMASCTVTVNVTSNAVGAFTNDASNISPSSGVNPPGSTVVTFTNQPEMSIVKSSTTTTLPAVGGSIPYSFQVTNTGNVTLTAIAITDPVVTGITCPVTTLTPGTATTCTGAHTVTQADIDANAVINTASVTGTPPVGGPIPPVPSNRVTITGNPLPALSIVKSSPTVTIPTVGSSIPYSFLVTNTGNVTVTAIAVNDPNITGAVTCPVTTLAPAASTTCTGSHVVVQADLDAGLVVNTASVVGTPPSGTPIPPVPSNQVTIDGVQTPALSIVKSSTATQVPSLGETVPYSFLVTNTGNVTMTAIAVTDPNITGPITCPVTTLAPGESTTCTGEHLTVQADIDAGEITNTAAVTGVPPNGTTLPPVPSNTLTIPADQNPELAIVKASTTTVILAVGDVVPYTFDVVNIGNVSMTAITVTDPNATGIFCPDFSLAPGESTTCTGNHTATQADLDAGQVVNTATVVGTPPSGTPIAPTLSNQVTIPVAQVNSLAVLKSSTVPRLPAVGSPIPYEFTVTNNGNVTMTDITVTDPNATGISCPVTTLAPGESTVCTGAHTVIQADVNAGSVVNTASVVGTPPSGPPIPPMPSNEVTILAAQTPALSIVKASTTTTITTIGQAVPYTFTVVNTGNVTITDIAVSDPKITGVSCPATTLDPGVSTVCTGVYATTPADLDNGQVVNTATATGTPPANAPPLAPTPSNTVTIPVGQAPALSMIKSASSTQVTAVGDMITFTFVITNTGNVTMSSITVNDPKVGTVNCPDTTLGAGASTTCTASYTVTQADVDAGQVVNIASVTGTPPGGGTPIQAVMSNEVHVPIPPRVVTPSMPDPTQLPQTGGNSTTILQIVLILIFVGSGLLIISRRRKHAIS